MQEQIRNIDRQKSQSDWVTEKIQSALRGLRYGSVMITVHDSRIVQIERMEKVRLDELSGHEKGDGI
jgi:hypothetical protein